MCLVLGGACYLVAMAYLQYHYWQWPAGARAATACLKHYSWTGGIYVVSSARGYLLHFEIEP